MSASQGPIAAPQGPLDGADTSIFPNNVVFVTGNYVLDRDELVEAQTPERCGTLPQPHQVGASELRRRGAEAYVLPDLPAPTSCRHPSPGAPTLVILWQEKDPYGNNLQELLSNPAEARAVQFLPDIPEVGFSSYELVATPHNISKGFQRPVYLFHKACFPSH
ncbi:7SK snRNA methylphosphate capping enzyme [Camelus dromedarius]|uniref:RNA methyltransferase n=1 Tax=Camelus dromedarius TaxID=9838 RepID=A0A5N4EFB1_CAMDR|nr:7SK snRNA methylphosphate capping enzyme [Camelus dromedarius]